jgi:hypothetical protein
MNEMFAQQQIQPSDTFQDILEKMCFCHNGELFINYTIFKLIGAPTTYPAILSHIFETTKKTASEHSKVVARIYIKSMTIGDLDKHKQFFLDAIKKLSNELPDILEVCHLYKTPFVFDKIFTIMSFAIDKETRQKVRIVPK